MKARSISGISSIIQRNRAQQTAADPGHAKYQKIMQVLGRSDPFAPPQSSSAQQQSHSPIKEKKLEAPTLKAKTIGVTPPPQRTTPTLKQVMERIKQRGF